MLILSFLAFEHGDYVLHITSTVKMLTKSWVLFVNQHPSELSGRLAEYCHVSDTPMFTQSSAECRNSFGFTGSGLTEESFIQSSLHRGNVLTFHCRSKQEELEGST